ncbi:MAG: hypothetical protein V9E81_02330 [Marmoricola sp.]
MEEGDGEPAGEGAVAVVVQAQRRGVIGAVFLRFGDAVLVLIDDLRVGCDGFDAASCFGA